MVTHIIKVTFAGFALGLLTLGVLVLIFSVFIDPNVVGNFFEKAFLSCQVALTIAWSLAIRHRLK